MQIQTPKKYRGVQRRSIIGCRRLSCLLLLIALIGAGIGVYLNQAVFAPIVQEAFDDVLAELEARAATIAAPPPTATPDPSNKLVEARNLWAGGALRRATDIYQEIADSLPNQIEPFGRIAIGLINSSRYEEAVLYAERAINAQPYSAEAWAISAWALDWADRPTEALPQALRALELEPENSRAQAYLAEIYCALGQPERGLAEVAAALENNPDSAEAYRARGFIKDSCQYDYTGAIEDYQTAYAMSENMPLYAIDIAIVQLLALRDYEAARGYLQDALEANSGNAPALFYLGQVQFAGDGNYPRAQRTLQECVDLNSNYYPCYYQLGRAQFSLNLLENAVESFEKAIELGSQNPQHYYWAGETHRQLKNCPSALAYLEPGLRLAIQTDSRFRADIEAVIPNCDPSFVPQTSAAADSAGT